MRMGLREANQKFSRAMKAVRAGREVTLTERGKPIAVIKPLRAGQGVEALVRLRAEGRLTGPLRPRPIRRRGWRLVAIRGGPLSATLREDRDARG